MMLPAELETELDGYYSMSSDERINLLARCYGASTGEKKRFWEGRLIEATIDVVDHPECLLHEPCACHECCSNA